MWLVALLACRHPCPPHQPRPGTAQPELCSALLAVPSAGCPPLPCQQDEAAIYAVAINGVSRPDAIRALKANGGDPDASLLFLLAERQEAEGGAGPDPAAVAELRANGLPQEDALAALSHCNGDVAAVRAYVCMHGWLADAPCLLLPAPCSLWPQQTADACPPILLPRVATAGAGVCRRVRGLWGTRDSAG